MRIAKRRDAAATEIRSGTFTGIVYSDPVLRSDEGYVNDIHFTPGARTHWHVHEVAQILYVVRGRGLIGTRGGHTERLELGDVVWIPAGEEHWHGAGPDTAFAHLAVSVGETVWLEPVDDADYHLPPA